MKSKSVRTFHAIYRAWHDRLPDETAKAYGGMVRLADKSCGVTNFLFVTEAALWDYVKSIDNVSMQRRAVSALHSFFNFALDAEALDRDPSRRINLRLLSREDSLALLERINYTGETTWGDIIKNVASRLHGRSEAAKELERRLMVRLRKCRTSADLRNVLREAVVSADP
ncbi:MAG: hypothetical protein ACYDDQ_00380 [Vulcanimicrobiaceae bacterium]